MQKAHVEAACGLLKRRRGFDTNVTHEPPASLQCWAVLSNISNVQHPEFRPERSAKRSRALPRRPVPGAGRRRVGQDARHYAKDRLHDRAPRLRSAHDRRPHVHEQGRARDAGAYRQAAQATQAGQAADGVHVPLAGRENPAPGSGRRWPEGQVFHHGQRRLLHRRLRPGRYHRQAGNPPHPERDLAVEKRPRRPRGRDPGRTRRGRGPGRPHLPQLCRDPAGLPGRRLRRPHSPAGGIVSQ